MRSCVPQDDRSVPAGRWADGHLAEVLPSAG